MKKHFLLLTLFVFGSFIGFSQSFVIGDINNLSDHIMYRNSRDYESIYANIDGSPFLKDEFYKGEVIVNDSLHITNVPLRYNILNDKIEFKNKQKQVLEIDNSKYNYQFIFNDRVFTRSNYIVNGKKHEGILELLVDGKISLYKKYSAEFKQATKAIGFQDAQPDRIIRGDEKYLIAFGDEIPEVVKNNKKDLFEKLKPLKADIEHYAKDEKLKLKSDAGLIQLIKYCNDIP